MINIIVLGNGYEIVDGKKIICNTKEKRQKLHFDRLGTSKTVIDNGKIIRVNTAELREKYKDFDNIQLKKDNLVNTKKTNKFERFRIPFKLINEFLVLCK